MAILYRVERKKIIESQLHIVNYVQNILDKVEGIFKSIKSADKADREYRRLLMEETAEEVFIKTAIEKMEG